MEYTLGKSMISRIGSYYYRRSTLLTKENEVLDKILTNKQTANNKLPILQSINTKSCIAYSYNHIADDFILLQNEAYKKCSSNLAKGYADVEVSTVCDIEKREEDKLQLVPETRVTHT